MTGRLVMDTRTVWRHIHAERAALAATLSGLSAEQWEAPSLCPGWTVQDVAAHVISNPQIRTRTLLAMVARNAGRGYNDMIFREVKALSARRTPQQILADFVTYAGSTRHVATTTVIEPLIDSLVHHQDIVRPLGIAHDMAPAAAAVAADRCRLLPGLMGSRALVRSVRMVATDLDWTRGRGPEIRGPMQELLMLCAGRARAATGLTGDGRLLLGERPH